MSNVTQQVIHNAFFIFFFYVTAVYIITSTAGTQGTGLMSFMSSYTLSDPWSWAPKCDMICLVSVSCFVFFFYREVFA